jgi:uncharacterized protein with PIN domain
VKFLADGMLGKLTRWLRMLGQDVEYSTQLSDDQLLTMAKAESRILLTKDFELYQRAIKCGIEAFYVEGSNEAERLAQLSKRYGVVLEVNMAESHCPRCNAKLNAATKEQVKNDVEANTYLYYDSFWKCPNCGHVYWQGAHWNQINATLKQAKIILEKKCVA